MVIAIRSVVSEGQEMKGRCKGLAQVGETPNKLVLKPGDSI